MTAQIKQMIYIVDICTSIEARLKRVNIVSDDVVGVGYATRLELGIKMPEFLEARSCSPLICCRRHIIRPIINFAFNIVSKVTFFDLKKR